MSRCPISGTWLAFCLFVGSLTMGPSAFGSPPVLAGTFSDMHCVVTEGDVVGTEITLLPGYGDMGYRYYALVQFAEGVAGPPQLVSVRIRGREIAFTVSYLGSIPVRFSGHVDVDALQGSFGAPLHTRLRLPRRQSFWTPGLGPGAQCAY